MKRDAISNRLYGPLVLSGAIASFTLFGFALAPKSSFADSAQPPEVVQATGTMTKAGVQLEVKTDAGTP